MRRLGLTDAQLREFMAAMRLPCASWYYDGDGVLHIHSLSQPYHHFTIRREHTPPAVEPHPKTPPPTVAHRMPELCGGMGAVEPHPGSVWEGEE